MTWKKDLLSQHIWWTLDLKNVQLQTFFRVLAWLEKSFIASMRTSQDLRSPFTKFQWEFPIALEVHWRRRNHPLQWEFPKTREVHSLSFNENFPKVWEVRSSRFNESFKTREVYSSSFNNNGDEEDSKLEARQTHQHSWMHDRCFQDQTPTSSSADLKMWQTYSRPRWWSKVVPSWRHCEIFKDQRSVVSLSDKEKFY